MTSMNSFHGLGLLLGLGLAAGSVLAEEGNIERGKQAAAVCAACHQADGSGMEIPNGESWPRLAGLPAEYIAKQLLDCKEGWRTNTTMLPFANMLDEQQRADIAAYFSSLESPQLPTAYRAADPEDQAEWLAERGDCGNDIPACNQCHGPNGLGVGSAFPPLAGQHAGYIEAQLYAWRDGSRDNDPNGLMKGVAERLSEAQIELIADYYATLPERVAERGLASGQEENEP